MTALKAWTVIVLEDEARENVLLLHRAADRPTLPDQVTGIGGKVELEMGEAANIEDSGLRELEEETAILRGDIEKLRMRLATVVTVDGLTKIIYWMTGVLKKKLENMQSSEGKLQWYAKTDLPLPVMTKAAKQAIPFMLQLAEDDNHVYTAACKVRDNSEWEMITM